MTTRPGDAAVASFSPGVAAARQRAGLGGLARGGLLNLIGAAVSAVTGVLDKVGRPAVQLVAVVLAATTGSVTLLTVAWAAPWVACAALAGWWLARLQRPARAAGLPPADRAMWIGFWRFTGPRAVTSIV